MNAKLLAVVGVVVLLLVGGAGAFLTGFGPAPGGDSGSDVETFPTETPSSSSGSDGGSTGDGNTGDGSTDATATATATETPPFTFAIDDIEECGQTCRDVTSTLTNQQDGTAENVTVYTRIFAGQGTDGDQIWQGSEDVGTLEAGGSHTATRRVELSYGDAYAVEQNDGWITIQTTVDTADQTVTFTEQRKVA